MNELLIFDSDNPGWKTGAWSESDSTYDFDSPDQNHTQGGAESVYIHHSPSEWDATSFTMDSGSIDARQCTHISLWLFPLEPDPEFRLCLRLDGTYIGKFLKIY